MYRNYLPHIYHKSMVNIGKYSIHGAFGYYCTIQINHIHVDGRQYTIVTWMVWVSLKSIRKTQQAVSLEGGQWRELQVYVIPPGFESFAHLRKSNYTSTWREGVTIHSWRYYFLGDLDWFEGSIWIYEVWILVVYLGKLCQLRLQVSFHPNFTMLLDFLFDFNSCFLKDSCEYTGQSGQIWSNVFFSKGDCYQIWCNIILVVYYGYYPNL